MRYYVNGMECAAAAYAAAAPGKGKAAVCIDSQADIDARAAEEASKAICDKCGKVL